MAIVNKKIREKEMIRSLSSKDAKIIEKALSDMKKLGKPSMLPKLIEVYSTSSSPQVKEGLENIFFQLKDPNSLGFLIEALKNDEYKNDHNIFASAIWQSGLDASDNLSILVELALKSDYLTCLEILTIIENIESGLNETEIEQNIAAISEQLQWKKSDNDALLASIVEVLQNYLVE